MKLAITDSAIEWIANNGFDPVYGARPIKRSIQSNIETPIAKAIISGDYIENQTIKVTVLNNKLNLA